MKPSYPTAIHQLAAEARAGTLSSRLIARTQSGWAILSCYQQVRGYCLLIPDPVVPSLNDLTLDNRRAFLCDMARLGDALLWVTGAERINYEILGNSEPALHAHLFPRYHTESPSMRGRPIWFSDWKQGLFEVERDGPLVEALAAAFQQCGLVTRAA